MALTPVDPGGSAVPQGAETSSHDTINVPERGLLPMAGTLARTLQQVEEAIQNAAKRVFPFF